VAGSVNKVILVGNLGNDPEIRTFQNGGRIANLSLATSENWKDKSTGERKERTQWHRVVINSEPLVNLCEKYIKKGSKLYIEGQLETRKYTDNSGVEKYTTEVVLRPYRGEITMLDSKGSSGSSGNYTPSDSQGNVSGGNTGGSFADTSSNNMDDEIPF